MEYVKYRDTTLHGLEFDKSELYALLGYNNHIPSQDILDMVDELLSSLLNACVPHCGYKICKGQPIDKLHVEVDDILLNTGKVITHAMKDAQYIAVFTATLGEGFDKWLQELRLEDNILHDYLANAIGSVLVEGVVAQLMQDLEFNVQNEGFSISNNYSPGYCDWILEEQKKIFNILSSQDIRIRLTDSCMMVPVKSVSGIVAIGEKVKKRPYKCSICKMENCIKNTKKAEYA